MIVLCNVAKWNKYNIPILAEYIFPGASLVYTSSNKFYDEIGVIDEFIKNLHKKEFVNSHEDLDIIKRCRVLRLLDFKISTEIVGALRKALIKLLVSNSINVVITELVDQYFHDILVREAKKLNILVISPIQTFVNGYSRLTHYGERITSRVVGDDEINGISNYLNNQIYEPNYVSNLKVTNNFQYTLRIAKNIARYLYFSGLLIFPSNKNNYHYLASSLGLRKYGSLLSFKQFRVNENYENCFELGTYKYIYIPLQFYPESTIDYWCRDLLVIDYENSLLALIKRLSSKFKIVLKDHPASFGFRSPKFIKRVNELLNENIFFVPTSLASNLIIERVDAVVVWTGSVGFEAAFRNNLIKK